MTLFLITFFSCQKKLSTEIENSRATTVDNNFVSKNKELINALIEGRLITTSAVLGGANQSNSISSSSQGYSISQVAGMLKFNNSNELSNFLRAADSAVTLWDGTNDVELLGDYSEKNISGDPALNSFDNTIGFNSLRKKYEMLAYDNPNFRDTIKTYIPNPDLQTVLNAQNEVQVGDTIYKYLSTHFMAKIGNSNYSLLQELRNNGGKIIHHANVQYINPVNNMLYVVPPSPNGTTACTAYFIQPTVTTDPSDNRRKTISFYIFTLDGSNYGSSFITGQINWGDGSSTTLNLVPTGIPLSYMKTYNVNPAPGVCSTFTISLTGVVAASTLSSCNGVSVTPPSPMPINVCGVTPNCSKSSHWLVTDPPLYFAYGGINYRITGQIGLDNRSGFFDRKIIWATTYWAKQVGGSWFSTSNKKVRLGAEVFNKYYTSNCATLNTFYKQEWRFNRSNITVKYETGKSGNGDEENAAGWVPDFLNAIRSNHSARIVEKSGNVVPFIYQNHYLR
jgi:hypothetical protein